MPYNRLVLPYPTLGLVPPLGNSGSTSAYIQVSGGSKGGARDVPPGSEFFHFHVVFGKKIG